ncbi:MAG: parallel beta-helix domain-containing protein [Betaproteobacteria bacterium]
MVSSTRPSSGLRRRIVLLTAFLSLGLTACGGDGSGPDDPPSVPGTTVTAARMNDEDLNTIFFLAHEGDTITLPAGHYVFNRSLKLSVNRLTIVGAGDGSDPASNTILSFKGAAESNGVEARYVKGVIFRKFAVEDAVGNAVFVTDSSDVVIDTVRAEWTDDPLHSSQMAYGLYPVASDNVLITNCTAIGTRDAGVYVGQSKNVRVIGNEAYFNVAGVEIENSRNSVVDGNNVHDNTAGILVFALPGAFRFLDNTGTVVRNNTVINNNRPLADTAQGFVRSVPPGTGIMAMAAQDTEILGNVITSHKTASVLAVSFQALGIYFDSDTFDPYLRGLYAHDNKIADFGDAPDGPFADPAGLAPLVSGLFASLEASGLPARMPAIIWDGIVDVTTGSTGANGEGGHYTGNLQICSNGNVTDLPLIPNVISYENIDIDLLALIQGLSAGPIFPFPPRMDCTITLPPVTGLP